MTATMRRLNDSARMLAAGREIQRRLNVRIIRARIEKLRANPNNLAAVLVADELAEILEQITSATR